MFKVSETAFFKDTDRFAELGRQGHAICVTIKGKIAYVLGLGAMTAKQAKHLDRVLKLPTMRGKKLVYRRKIRRK